MAPKKKTPARSVRRTFGRLRQFRSGRWKASYTGPDGMLYDAPMTFALKLDAEAWLTDRRREIDRELWSPPASVEQKRDAAKQKRAAAERFDEYAARWLESRTVKGRALRPRTVEHYRGLLDDHLLPVFGAKPVRDITMESVDSWYAKTLKDRPTLRSHAYSLLRAIMETARTRDRIIDANPCLIRGGGSTTRKVKPEPATLEQLETITDEMPERYRLMVPLAAWCQPRFGELIELRRQDVVVTKELEAVLKIRRGAARVGGGFIVGDPKSEAGVRDVAVPPHIVPALVDHLDKFVGEKPDALLFPALGGGHLQPSTLYRHFYRAREKAGRPDLRWHDLRHSGAVLAAQAGATLAELMSRLGHSTVGAAMRYQHAAQGRDQQIAAAMSALTQKAP
ncbi:tyrosine-type recombinase/integrase [Mycobacteroides sp. PCS013]|uniref:tyrosine-type recombinase/integrase n=1 Tax=Mycobacteroides sp. PCS013 TaxID=3074106 RepID=UPI003C2D8A35